VPLFNGCPKKSPPFPEVTEVICRVPSALFSPRLGTFIPVHQCRFAVRPMYITIRCVNYFLDNWNIPWNPIIMKYHLLPSFTTRWRNINLLSIDYDFRPRLRSRLTLPRSTWDRNPWTFGGSDFHTSLRYLCQHSHFHYLQYDSRLYLHRFMERSATNSTCVLFYNFGDSLSPVEFLAQGNII